MALAALALLVGGDAADAGNPPQAHFEKACGTTTVGGEQLRVDILEGPSRDCRNGREVMSSWISKWDRTGGATGTVRVNGRRYSCYRSRVSDLKSPGWHHVCLTDPFKFSLGARYLNELPERARRPSAGRGGVSVPCFRLGSQKVVYRKHPSRCDFAPPGCPAALCVDPFKDIKWKHYGKPTAYGEGRPFINGPGFVDPIDFKLSKIRDPKCGPRVYSKIEYKDGGSYRLAVCS